MTELMQSDSPQVVTAPQPKNRVTIVENIYFQERFGGSSILPVGTPYAYEVESEELPFQRKFKAGPEWKSLPGVSDWLDGKAGLIKVENVEGQYLQVNPTDEEKQDISKRIVEIGIKVGDVVYPFAEAHPGRSFRIEAYSGGEVQYMLRARHGVASYWLHVFPR